MTYYVGLDVSLRSVNICVIDEEGTVVREDKVDSEPEEIVTKLRSLKPEIKALGLEAGTLTQYLTYGLQHAGYEVVCMEARQVSASLAAMRNKTDKNDARGIAQILRTGWYSRVHVKSIESHHIRALLSARKAVLRKCTDLENEVRGLFKVFGIKLPSPLKHGAFDGAVRERIEADPALAHALLPLLDARLVLYRTFLEMEGRARKMAAEDPICRRLMTAPGIGAISALRSRLLSMIPNVLNARGPLAHTSGLHLDVSSPVRWTTWGISLKQETLMSAPYSMPPRTPY